MGGVEGPSASKPLHFDHVPAGYTRLNVGAGLLVKGF